MFSLLRIASAGAIAIVLVAGASLSSTSATHQAEKALRTKQELNSLAELVVTGGLTTAAAKVGTDAWGGVLYLMPVCTSSPAASLNTVVLVGMSGGAAKALSPNLGAAVLNVDGSLKTSFFANSCFPKEGTSSWLSGGAGIPGLSDLPDFIEFYTYGDTLSMSGNQNAATSVRTGGSTALSTQLRSASGIVGSTDGELRFFAAEKTLYFWKAATQQWSPVQGDSASIKGHCKQGRLYVPTTEFANASVEPAFCLDAGEVLVPARSEGPIDRSSMSYLAGGLGSPQPYADRRVKLADSAQGGEPVHAVPSVVTYNEARMFCAQMGESLMTGAQLSAMQLQTSVSDFTGYQPQSSSLLGQAGTPCKGTNSGFNVCAVDPASPQGAVSFVGTGQQRAHGFGAPSTRQYVWDLGGNLAEWVWSGPGALDDSEEATVLGEGLFYTYSGGALTANWLAVSGLTTTSPLSKAGFRCSGRPI